MRIPVMAQWMKMSARILLPARKSAITVLLSASASLGCAQADGPAMQQPTLQLHEAPEATPAKATLAARESELRGELAAHPDSAPVLYQLGLLLRQQNKPKESLEVYTRAAKVQKPGVDELRSVALDYVLLNDMSDAIHWLEIAALTNPTNADVLYALGRCYYSQSQYHEAEVAYLRLLAIKPDHLKAEENLGLTFEAENQSEKAEEALRKAVAWSEKRPHNELPDEWPFLDLGSFLLDHDRAQEAVPFLQKATQINSTCAACHEKLGRALEQSGKAADGVKELQTAAQLDPKNPNIHFELGHAYRQTGAIDKARAEFSLSEELRHERDKN
jgi:tetratricopeptide (TPR) repeat protein